MWGAAALGLAHSCARWVCAGRTQTARPGPAFSLRIPITGLNPADDLGQPCAVGARRACSPPRPQLGMQFIPPGHLILSRHPIVRQHWAPFRRQAFFECILCARGALSRGQQSHSISHPCLVVKTITNEIYRGECGGPHRPRLGALYAELTLDSGRALHVGSAHTTSGSGHPLGPRSAPAALSHCCQLRGLF